ncbi:MAG: hypothetical protein LBP87_02890 [Planctomycetaceae bacterium]|nr:hypothetical protein [Planctomycetaceae bacterium]
MLILFKNANRIVKCEKYILAVCGNSKNRRKIATLISVSCYVCEQAQTGATFTAILTLEGC